MNIRIIVWCSFAVLIVLGCAEANSATGAEQDVMAAERQVIKANQTNDVGLVAPLIADKLVTTDQDGTVLVGKAENLAAMKATTVTSYEVTDMKVTVFGDTAIATGTYSAKGTYQGKAFDYRGRFTDTWARLNGKWLGVASHSSLIKK